MVASWWPVVAMVARWWPVVAMVTMVASGDHFRNDLIQQSGIANLTIISACSRCRRRDIKKQEKDSKKISTIQES